MLLNSLRNNMTFSIFNDIAQTVTEKNPISASQIEYIVARYLVAIDDALVRIQIRSEHDDISSGEAKGLQAAVEEINMAITLIRRSIDTAQSQRKNEDDKQGETVIQEPVQGTGQATASKNGRRKRAKKS